MRGTITIIRTNGTFDTQHVEDAAPVGALRAAVGGPIESVPYFDRYQGKRCVAFCHEEGKLEGLPPNYNAQALWREVSALAHVAALGDQLAGDIAIVQGDEEFMEAL